MVNNTEIAKQLNIGPIAKNPKDGLSAGHDVHDAVGDYTAPFKYPGKIGKITLQAAPGRRPSAH
jgi:hypothetical protein